MFDPFPFHKPPTIPKKLIEFAPSTLSAAKENNEQSFPISRRQMRVPVTQLRKQYSDQASNQPIERKAGIPHRLAPLSKELQIQDSFREAAPIENIGLTYFPDASEGSQSKSEDDDDEYATQETSYTKKFMRRMSLSIIKVPEQHTVRLLQQKSYKNVAKFDSTYATILSSLDKNINANIKKLEKL
jgi:hypothetical protein